MNVDTLERCPVTGDAHQFVFYGERYCYCGARRQEVIDEQPRADQATKFASKTTK